MTSLTSLEICAGGGGQALGLELAGFDQVAAIEIETIACETLSLNRPAWNVVNRDVREIEGRDYLGIDLLAGGVPCPPFSIASRQLGENDERDLFPAAIDLVESAKPRAVILENVPGLASGQFSVYRAGIRERLEKLGYEVRWQVLNAADFGVPQLRPRFILVALKADASSIFEWPLFLGPQLSVGQALKVPMASRGWRGAEAWTDRANTVAPTLVGGSKLHGGPDLGPTRAKRAWRDLGVDGMGIADLAPDETFPIDGLPKLTVAMTALVQGFPESWTFAGRKTAAYRQVGNAFPPPVAKAVGSAVRSALLGKSVSDEDELLSVAQVG